MADEYIKREAVLDYIDHMPSELTSDGRRMIRRIRLTEYISDSIPAADVVEVVRCKDCTKSNYDKDFGKRWCCRLLSPFEVTDDSFCASGRWKSNGADMREADDED